MGRGLVLSAALVVVAMSSSANAGLATVQSDGLFKGEELINFAKALLGDALDFVGDTAVNALAKTKSVITKLSDNDKLADFMGSRGWEFDASDLVDKNLLEHLKDADTFDAAFAALEEAVEEHCTPNEAVMSEKVNSMCKGPELELELQPKTCVIDASGHQIDCEPARLVMRKIPAKCTYKHHSPFEFVGDWCAIEKYHGVETVVTKGGDTYTTTVQGLKGAASHLNKWADKEDKLDKVVD